MSLTAADVAEIMRLVEQSSFDELTLEIGEIKLTLRRGAGATSVRLEDSADKGCSDTAAPRAAAALPAASSPSAGQEPTASAARVSADVHEAGVHEVAAPLLGTFYRAPKPGAAPFVEPGSTVEEDTVVAIIEVMKLMNTVRAGVRGTVTEILVSDGALVEYEQPLLRVRKAG